MFELVVHAADDLAVACEDSHVDQGGYGAALAEEVVLFAVVGGAFFGALLFVEFFGAE